MIIAGTGHRPPTLGLGYAIEDKKFLVEFAIQELKLIQSQAHVKELISGFAQGWDQALVIACLQLNIPFRAAIPFKGQERKWPKSAQKEYQQLLAKARNVIVVCPGDYANWKFTRRDMYMVDECDLLLALWSGIDSGTGTTVKYAQSKTISIVNSWDRWKEKYESFYCR